MTIADLLTPDRVLVLEERTDKGSLLRTMATHAAKALLIDAGRLADELLTREELGSTGLGAGVAIPHAQIAEVKHPLGVLALLRNPIDFDAIDEEPVDIVFMLALPTSQAALSALSRTARVLRQEDIAVSLRQADLELNPKKAVSILSAQFSG
ncbi:MAG: hypothetical protein ABS76_07890 [Pelagibacterium sp. SCN 64-44]|nr:MAG: hypothetical protein ABS76_07890 [Pelagibacterium sp. SCN 64-44]